MTASVNGVDEKDMPRMRHERNDDRLDPRNLLPFSMEIGPGTALPDKVKKQGPSYNLVRGQQPPLVEVKSPELKAGEVVPGNVIEVPNETEV